MKSRFLDEGELKKLREVSNDEAFLPMLLSLETGLRIGDVVGLRTKDLKSDGVHFTAQKTGKKGIAKISDSLRRKLKRSASEAWLFPSPYKAGKHLSRQAVWQRMKKAGERAGLDLDGLSPHSLRKAFAVEVYRTKGFKAVQEALQHNNTASTEIYSFADWNTGKNADLPLKRRDLQLVVRMCLEALGSLNNFTSECKSDQKKRG